jgi:hypothetical protein
MADAAAETNEPPESSKGTGPPESSKGSVPHWRRVLCGVLVVLGCVLAPLSIHSVWIHNTLLNTDQYVSTVGPLAQNPEVQDALATRITNTLVSSSKVETRIKNALPPKVSSIVAPVVASGLGTVVHAAALRIVQSPKFEQLWKGLNRRIHTRVVDVLRGQGKFVNGNGQVAVNIQPVIDEVNSALNKVGISGLSNAASQSSHEVVLFSSNTLKQAQGGVRLLDDLAIALPIITVLLFAGAILVSANRRRTVLRSALGLAFVMLLFLVIWNALRTPYQHALPATVNRDAAGAVYDQLISFLLLALRTVLAFALVVALGAWLAGPSRLAIRIRTGTRSLISRSPGQSAISTKTAGFVDRQRTPLRVLVVGVGLVLLVLLNHPGPIAVLVIAIVVLVLLGVIELLGRGAPASADSVSAPR